MYFGPTTAAEGRLTARPQETNGACEPGLRSLGLPVSRDALLYVPKSANGAALPLVVLLHGSGGDASGIIGVMRTHADREGFLLLAPQSRQYTWDMLLGGFGPDVRSIDDALARTFAQCRVDHQKIAVAGFSDGASYALSLGVTNGDLFRSVMAFSPGFMVPGETQGRPNIFISHGKDDRVLPIARCSRRLVPELKRDGYRVDYREFEGGHQVPSEMVDAALQEFLHG